MIRFEYECAGEGCGFASDDMQEALDHCNAGAAHFTSAQIAVNGTDGKSMRKRAAKREKTNNEH